MTGIALMIRGPAHNFPGAVEFVIAVLVIILAIFFRMYGPRRRSGPPTEHRTTRRIVRRSAHRSGRPTAHGAGNEPGQNINNGRRSSSKRRGGRP
jgi:hypothetical protein